MSLALRLQPVSRIGRVQTPQCLPFTALTQRMRSISYRSPDSHAHQSAFPSLVLRPYASQLKVFRLQYSVLTPLASHLSPNKAFSSASLRFQQQSPKEEVRDPPREAKRKGFETDQERPGESNSGAGNQSGKGSEDSDGDNSENTENGKEKKREPPPPPPHGNKTPWQVFTETLQSEFKASKEWNESTKAIASSAHSFSENESVKRARTAYTAASGAATSTATSAIKGTGKVLGQTAAWTWETPVVKGVRSGVNATGRGLEKATRPVRETKVYQKAVGGVKDVIDDGSSSKYGGWVEKEERRKQRELRELKEAGEPGRPSKRMEKMEEDPK